MNFKYYLTLFYRLFLVYFFYQIARVLFWWYNKELIDINGFSEYLSLAYRGIAFDTTAILYINSLFIFLSIIPIGINSKKYWQKILFWWYFITNGIAYSWNFGDFIYFKFSQSRLTSAALDVAGNETNLGKVFWESLKEYPSVGIGYILLMALWIFLYNRVKITEVKPKISFRYFAVSILVLCGVATLAVGGIRGDFKHSTRPINLVDANKHVRLPIQGNIVLNSSFSFLRTLGSNQFKEVNFVDETFINHQLLPYKQYNKDKHSPSLPPNIVILIVESFGREYSGAFNEGKNIENYQSFTPFVDSLAKHSLIFPNSFANGRQSIHGMSSILAGIPTHASAFTSSPYANQKISSIVSIANEMGYDTSFYHGAPNGSMGFQGFANILGFQHYFGKNEYNNDEDFDGMWAIWDEPFLQYFAKNIGKKKPFLTTMFTASSHHPFKIPEKYKGKFQKGFVDMHEPMQYTDYALKKFFETAEKQPWYENTIFVITGDHTNQVYYSEYHKAMNGYAVPILFFSPNPTYELIGKNEKYAQQMDIYPTLVDIMGYEKPFRSWGKSLISEDDTSPHIIITSDGITIRAVYGDYIYLFDGKNFTGLYAKEDLGFEQNLLSKTHSLEVERGKKLIQAWYQDYMHKIIQRKLG